jgi:hypothetical protein
MSKINPGDIVRLKTDPPFTNAAGTPTDPTTVKVRWRRFNEETVWTYGVGSQVVRDGAGVYHADLEVTEIGTYYFRWEGTGTVEAAEESTFISYSDFR